jgi:hypothetical protein
VSARAPWEDEAAHLAGPDAARCPFCAGARQARPGALHAVALANGDRPLYVPFRSPHCAWSYYDALSEAWNGAALVEVLEADACFRELPPGDPPPARRPPPPAGRWRQPYSAARGYPPASYRAVPGPLPVVRVPRAPAGRP